MKTATASKVDHWERLKRLEQELMDLRDRNAQLEAKIRVFQVHEMNKRFNAGLKKGIK